MPKPAGRRPPTRDTLRFLTWPPNIRDVAAVMLAAAVLGGMACENRTLGPQQPDGGDGGLTSMCANVGCAAPPLCSQGCQATCGCCSCAPGERSGNLLCVGGCYVPAQDQDAGGDAEPVSADAQGDVPIDDWVSPAACMLPFEAGPCDGAIRVYASVNGACVERVYGGCGGNGNRFSSLEECMLTCEGRPVALPCPTGRVAQEICIACGPAGGCGKTITACAQPCGAGTSCPSNVRFCFEGVCQVGGCI
jgi:hypothetical protein